MDLETTLSDVPFDNWTLRQAIVFDWQDGPRQGLCALANPVAEFLFDLAGERHNPDGLDDRLFRLREVPPGTISAALDALAELGRPNHEVWVPVWKFTDVRKQQQAEHFLHEISVHARPVAAVIATRDFEQFQGCWRVSGVNGQAVDWLTPVATCG